MGISPGGVHNQTTLVVTHSLCEASRSLLQDDVPPSGLTGYRSVEGLARVLGVGKLGDGDLLMQTRLSALTLDGRTVDGKVSKVSQQLLRSVLTGNQFEEVRGVVDKGSPGLSAFEDGVSQETDQEGDVGLRVSRQGLEL